MLKKVLLQKVLYADSNIGSVDLLGKASDSSENQGIATREAI